MEEVKKYNKHEGEISEYRIKDCKGNEIIAVYKKKKYISPEMIEDMKAMVANKVKKNVICQKYCISYPTLKKYVK